MRTLLPLLRILPLLLLAWMPAAYAADGCGTPGATQRVAIPDTGRAMLIHVPAGFRASEPAPLLFVFHGSGEDGARVLVRSRLEATSDRHGFILAAPDGGITSGGGFVWNIPGVPSVTGRMPAPTDANDVAFVERAIGWLAAQHCVDPARVYATGISGGGRMSSLLGCIAADRFAGIAPVVGLRAGIPLKSDPGRPDPASCRPSRPMPVIAFAGDKDTTNPIEGFGAPYWQYSMQAAEARWAALDGCASPLARRQVTALVYEEGYTGCRAGTQVVARITIGGTHDWVVDNEAMWTFLARYRLR